MLSITESIIEVRRFEDLKLICFSPNIKLNLIQKKLTRSMEASEDYEVSFMPSITCQYCPGQLPDDIINHCNS